MICKHNYKSVLMTIMIETHQFIGYGVTANIAASHSVVIMTRQLGVRFPVSEVCKTAIIFYEIIVEHNHHQRCSGLDIVRVKCRRIVKLSR